MLEDKTIKLFLINENSSIKEAMWLIDRNGSGIAFVVDDNETNLSLIAKILGLDGYQVTIACNGQAAIQSVEQEMPDQYEEDMKKRRTEESGGK